MKPISVQGINFNDRGAYWSLGQRDTPSTAVVPAGTTFLYLDPRRTTPNVLLGVDVQGQRYVMAPGDCIPVGRTVRSVLLWNPLRSLFTAGDYIQSGPGLVGYLDLRAGTADEALPLVTSKPHRECLPPANVLFMGRVSSGSVISLPTTNLSGLRISLRGINNITNVPRLIEGTDFVGGVKVGHRVVGGNWDAAGLAAPVASDALPMAQVDEADAGSNSTMEASDQDVVVVSGTGSNHTWDRQVVAGSAAVRLTPYITSGTNFLAGWVALFVEGR